MKSKRIYLDASAYLALLCDEQDSVRIRSLIRKRIICSSIIMVAEIERNLLRLARESSISISQYESCKKQFKEDVESIVIKDLTMDLCLNTEYPAIKTPKTLDLIHIRTAVWFVKNGGLEYFVTLDHDQGEAANEMGLVVKPGH